MNFAAPKMTADIVSALDLIHKPEIYNKLVGRYPLMTDLDWLESMKKLIPVNADEFKHHEEDEIVPVQTIASKSNSGNDVVITLDSSNHAASGKRSFPRVGNLVQFKNLATGLIIDKSTAVDNAHTITVRRLNSSINVQSAAVAGDSFIVFSNAFEHGTSGPSEAVIPTTTVVTNTLQTFYDMFKVDSHEEANQTWVTFTNPTTGKKEARYYLKGEADTVDRFRMAEAEGLFITPQASGLTDADGNSVATTKALIPTLNDSANVLQYSTVGMQNMQNVVKMLNNVYAAEGEFMWCEGLNYSLENVNAHVDFAKNGGVSYNTFGGGEMGKNKAASLGFNSINFSNVTFHFKRLNILNHAGTTGAPGFPYPDYFIVIPMGAGIDKKTKEMVDYFGIRYKKLGGKGARDHWKVWETGGGSDAGTDNSLTRRVNYSSVKGLQVFGAKRYVLGKKNA